MTRVQLDSGLDSLTGGDRCSKRGGSNKRGSSVESSIRSNTGKSSMESSIRSNTGKSSMESGIRGNSRESNSGDSSVNVGNNVSWKTSKQTLTTKSSIRVGKNSRDNSLLFLSITLLSLSNNLSLSNRSYLRFLFSNHLSRCFSNLDFLRCSAGNSSSIGSFKISPGGLNLISFSNSN